MYMGQPQLPYWLTFVNALSPLIGLLVTLVIGGVAAYIAHGQLKINRAKLKLDLFERRVAVYESARQFINGLTAHALVDTQAYREYCIAISRAPFLFAESPDIPEYLTLLGHEATRLGLACDLSERQQRGEYVQDVHANATNTKLDLLQWFLAQEKDPQREIRSAPTAARIVSRRIALLGKTP